MKKTGQLLKEARESKGISLQEVSIHLKINSRILRSLEEGDKDQLPAKTFLRGFVQSYAQFLKLDGAEILEMFQAEMGTTHPKMITKTSENGMDAQDAPLDKSNSIKTDTNATSGGVIEHVPVVVKSIPTPPASAVVETKKEIPYNQAPLAPSLSMDQKTWSRSMKIGTVVVIILIAGIIFGVVKTIEKYEREATIVKSESELEVLPRTEPEPLQLPLASENSALFQEGEPTHPETLSENSPANINSVVTPEAAKTEKAQNNTAMAGPPVETQNEVKETKTTTTETKPPEPVVNKPQEVIVEALDKVTIEYSIDDKPKSSMVLAAEKVHTFKGDKKLFLGFSDGGSVNIIYNGKDRGVLGNLGKPLQLHFPE